MRRCLIKGGKRDDVEVVEPDHTSGNRAASESTSSTSPQILSNTSSGASVERGSAAGACSLPPHGSYRSWK